MFEAMACGLPVVCGRRGGYADYIVHGVNGFLFDTSEQAVALILKLRDDAALRARIGERGAASPSRRSTAAAAGAASSASSCAATARQLRAAAAPATSSIRPLSELR